MDDIPSLEPPCLGQVQRHGLAWPGWGTWFSPQALLLLSIGNWIRMPQKAESPHVTASSTICLLLLNTLTLSYIHSLVTDSCLYFFMLNTVVYWPAVVSWPFSVIRFSPKGSRNLRPSLRHVSMVGWEIVLWFSFHLCLKKLPTNNFYRLHPQNQLLLNKG